MLFAWSMGVRLCSLQQFLLYRLRLCYSTQTEFSPSIEEKSRQPSRVHGGISYLDTLNVYWLPALWSKNFSITHSTKKISYKISNSVYWLIGAGEFKNFQSHARFSLKELLPFSESLFYHGTRSFWLGRCSYFKSLLRKVPNLIWNLQFDVKLLYTALDDAWEPSTSFWYKVPLKWPTLNYRGEKPVRTSPPPSACS